MITNQCQFLGRLGADVKVITFDSGDKVGNVSMAVDDSYKNKDGEKVERTVWVTLVFRNKLCEIVDKYAGKGNKVLVQGKYAPRKYEVDGNTRYSHEFLVQSMQLLEPKVEQENPSPAKDSKPVEYEPTHGNDNDGLPF